MYREMLHGEFLYNYEKIRISNGTLLHTRKNHICEVGDFYSLKYISGSDVYVTVDEKRYYVPDKSVLLFEKFISAKVSVLTPGADLSMINIDFKKSLYSMLESDKDDLAWLLTYIMGHVRKKNLYLPRFLFYTDTSVVIENMFIDTMKEYKQREIKYLDIVRSYITAILVKLFRNMENVNNATLEGDLIQRILDYTELHYNEKLTVAELSKIFHYSESYIEKKFKNTMEMTFPEFLRQKRIYSSLSIISNTYKNVDDLASRVGYSDTKCFIKNFKRYVGMTPLQYKKQSEKKKDWYMDMRDLKQQKERPY